MVIQRTATTLAFVLCGSLPQLHTVTAGHADGHALASLQLGGIGGLIVVACATAYIIGIAFLVVVQFIQSGLQLCLEGVQVHRIGVEDGLIHFFHLIPTLIHLYLIGVCLLLLSFLLAADDITVHPVTDAVGKAVFQVVLLLHLCSRPSCMVLRILQDCFPLVAVRIEVGICGVDSIPVVTFQYAVVIGRRHIVA